MSIQRITPALGSEPGRYSSAFISHSERQYTVIVSIIHQIEFNGAKCEMLSELTSGLFPVERQLIIITQFRFLSRFKQVGSTYIENACLWQGGL